MTTSSPLISAEELAAIIERPTVKLLDVRWRLDAPDGRDEFAAGHLPGAVYVDLEGELAAHGAPDRGRHPLPSVDDLQRAARAWGIDDGDTVVVYDDLGGMSAARAWWLLRFAGVTDVRVLDGAIKAWIAAGHHLETGPAVPAPGSISLEYGSMPMLSIDEAAALPDRGVLLDARAAERYRGDVEPIDPRAGHIPGALSAPTAANLGLDGRFLDPATLRSRFEALGISDSAEVGVYCGSGVTAAHDILALELAGFDAALFPGSWSAWSNTPGREVAVGDAPR